MNGNSIIANEYKVLGGTVVTLNNVNGDVIFENKVYDLDYVNKKSSDYKNSRRFIKVNWDKSFKDLHGSKSKWLDEMVGAKNKEIYKIKRSMNFPTNESYTTAVEMGDEVVNVNDYLVYLEGEVDVIKALKPKPKKATAKKDVEPLDNLLND